MVKFWGRDKHADNDQSKLGSRVFVRQDPEFGPGPWPAEPTGTIVGDLDGATWATSIRGRVPSGCGGSDLTNLSTTPTADCPYKESQVLERYLRWL